MPVISCFFFLLCSFTLSKPLRLCINAEFKLDKDLGIMSLCVWQSSSHFSRLSGFTGISDDDLKIDHKSKCEHKYRGIWTRNVYKRKLQLEFEIICVMV